jgi:hypothetical protein
MAVKRHNSLIVLCAYEVVSPVISTAVVGDARTRFFASVNNCPNWSKIGRRKVDTFGDESCGDAVITYGLFALPSERVVDVVAAIETIKSNFGAARTARLHCREMFKLDARSKGVWAHLRMDDVFSL